MRGAKKKREKEQRLREERARAAQDRVPPNPRTMEFDLYHCPVCHYPVHDTYADYFICPICHWEDDGQDDPYADEFNHLNGCSLTDARRLWAEHQNIDHGKFPPTKGYRLMMVQNTLSLFARCREEKDPAEQWDLFEQAVDMAYRIPLRNWGDE